MFKAHVDGPTITFPGVKSGHPSFFYTFNVEKIPNSYWQNVGICAVIGVALWCLHSIISKSAVTRYRVLRTLVAPLFAFTVVTSLLYAFLDSPQRDVQAYLTVQDARDAKQSAENTDGMIETGVSKWGDGNFDTMSEPIDDGTTVVKKHAWNEAGNFDTSVLCWKSCVTTDDEIQLLSSALKTHYGLSAQDMDANSWKDAILHGFSGSDKYANIGTAAKVGIPVVDKSGRNLTCAVRFDKNTHNDLDQPMSEHIAEVACATGSTQVETEYPVR